MYELVITPSAKRSLKRLSKPAQVSLLEEAKSLREDPTQSPRLKGSLSFLYSFHFKYKNVQYRMAYSIDEKRKLTVIHLVGPRENFYDRLKRLL